MRGHPGSSTADEGNATGFYCNVPDRVCTRWEDLSERIRWPGADTSTSVLCAAMYVEGYARVLLHHSNRNTVSTSPRTRRVYVGRVSCANRHRRGRLVCSMPENSHSPHSSPPDGAISSPECWMDVRDRRTAHRTRRIRLHASHKWHPC